MTKHEVTNILADWGCFSTVNLVDQGSVFRRESYWVQQVYKIATLKTWGSFMNLGKILLHTALCWEMLKGWVHGFSSTTEGKNHAAQKLYYRHLKWRISSNFTSGSFFHYWPFRLYFGTGCSRLAFIMRSVFLKQAIGKKENLSGWNKTWCVCIAFQTPPLKKSHWVPWRSFLLHGLSCSNVSVKQPRAADRDGRICSFPASLFLPPPLQSEI